MSNSKKLIPEDYPIKAEALQFYQNVRTSTSKLSGGVIRERVVIERDYHAAAFTKVFHNKDLLDRLSSDACKIFVYIVPRLDYETYKITVKHKDIKIDRRRTSRAIDELLELKVLFKTEVQSVYWFNITLLSMGDMSNLT